MKKISLFIAVLLFTAFNYTAQAVESQTAACTVGNLATVAASYLTTVTNLTVTGTIDARDFVTMRDAMPLLDTIDLSGCTVEGYTGMEGTNGATLTIYPTNGIPTWAFCNPSTWVGKKSLKSFIYPSLVTTIGNSAFENCSGLTGSLIIPASVTTIGENAFASCYWFSGSLTIPSSVTTIGDKAFYSCSGFKGSLTIASSVTTIGEYAFSRCLGLTGSLTIPPSVKTIGGNTFSECSGLNGSLTIPSSVTAIGDSAFLYCIGLTGSLTIPASVTTIGDRAFALCKGFTGSLTIPSSVTTIGYSAFYGCTGLTESLTIPSSVITINDGAFRKCNGLFTVDATNPNYSSLDGVLFNKDKTTLIQCPISKTGSYSLPSSVTTISNYAFSKCSGLTGSLTIPSSVTTIGDYSFEGCSGFTGSLTILSSITYIGYSAFRECSGFTGTLTLPSTMEYIDGTAFSGCSRLGSLIIPSSVKTICWGAFYNCTSLTSIYASATYPVDISKSVDVFSNVSKTACILHVPMGSKALYETADQWKDFTNIVEDVPTTLKEVSTNSITIFPNPATSYIIVSELSSLVTDKTVTLSVTDVLGSTIFTQEVEPSTSPLTIDVSTYKNGIYFIAIQTRNSRVVKRFVKE